MLDSRLRTRWSNVKKNLSSCEHLLRKLFSLHEWKKEMTGRPFHSRFRSEVQRCAVREWTLVSFQWSRGNGTLVTSVSFPSASGVCLFIEYFKTRIFIYILDRYIISFEVLFLRRARSQLTSLSSIKTIYGTPSFDLYILHVSN